LNILTSSVIILVEYFLNGGDIQMYKRVTLDYLDKFKEILLDDNLNNNKIILTVPRLNININIDKIPIPQRIKDFFHHIQFSYKGDSKVVKHENEEYGLALEIREGIDSKEEYSINIALSCDCSDFGDGTFGKDFYQIEAGDSLEDKEYLYIVRNITKLYNYDSEFLKKEYKHPEILFYNENYFLVISKIKKTDLDDVNKHSQIITDFLKNFIMCAFINEGLKIDM